MKENVDRKTGNESNAQKTEKKGFCKSLIEKIDKKVQEKMKKYCFCKGKGCC